VIYIVTVHHESDRWIALQAPALARWMPDAQVVAWLPTRAGGVPPGWITRTGDTPGDHAGRLNDLAAYVCRQAAGDDWLVTLDSDAWPVADPKPTLARLLSAWPLVAVRRDEAMGARQPHPCFSACRVGTWRRLPGDWVERAFVDAGGRARAAVGGDLLARLGDRWAPLLRLNRTSPHPVMLGLYGDDRPIVYHHGAGSREPSFLEERRTLRGSALAAQVERNRQLSTEWAARAGSDPDFWRALMVAPP
jgi:hypothetical protein